MLECWYLTSEFYYTLYNQIFAQNLTLNFSQILRPNSEHNLSWLNIGPYFELILWTYLGPILG